ncbi:MAG: hypothetical protein M1833_003266 [Piccolia ochrophora]|nr:MAG: hypothetical protein M1833_003266 [Piccolia ochrophora]
MPGVCEELKGEYQGDGEKKACLSDAGNKVEFVIKKTSGGVGDMGKDNCLANLPGQVRVCGNGGITRQDTPYGTFDFSAHAVTGNC